MAKSAVIPPARLIGLDEDVDLQEYMLRENAYTFGRAPTCHIIVQRPVVSRLHAKIEREGPRYVLADSNSANGTFVNGRPIRGPHLLKHNDLIGLGGPSPLFKFVDPDPTSAAQQGLSYDEDAMRFTLAGNSLQLPPGQFKLLRYLYLHAGKVCTREECAAAIWGRDYDPGLDAEALDKVIGGVRAALRKFYLGRELLETRRGFGYVLHLDVAEAGEERERPTDDDSPEPPPTQPRK